ncbi:hypothetical protein MIDIC_110064 [Alphaproteobacteria bacterium]
MRFCISNITAKSVVFDNEKTLLTIKNDAKRFLYQFRKPSLIQSVKALFRH